MKTVERVHHAQMDELEAQKLLIQRRVMERRRRRRLVEEAHSILDSGQQSEATLQPGPPMQPGQPSQPGRQGVRGGVWWRARAAIALVWLGSARGGSRALGVRVQLDDVELWF